ncbi:MAG: SIS domain-containing protein, partial [Planctomycetes bacterium]|nr:SIS domain-containing protein [Planctomycetota bacterium]
VESVRNTLRGKFELPEMGGVRFLLGRDVLPVELIAGLREGRVRQIALVGQGTAAVAAQGVAHLLQTALAGAPHPFQIFAEKAAEFSAYRLRPDMSDALVIAVSQSGTTTDTNRTVDLARGRGAWILSIVNRRNSDLVYKSHGVLYTSDGRDIEMSVASTKAFYAQNVAGQVLALGLASILGSMSERALRASVEDLYRLPDAMEQTLALGPQIAELARRFALRRRSWAVVGGGPAKIAADEIRIKLSELCYKSIAVDYLEDKKHIDLSSEPLVIVCAVGQPEDLVPDTVKEVAIFKAHRALPIVIAEAGERRFDPYAAGVVWLPPCRGALSYLPATMVGHLFGYHAADSMDAVADRLRVLRGAFVRLRETCGFGDEAIPEVLEQLSASMAPQVAELEDVLSRGDLDGSLPAGSAVRLSRALQLILARASLDGFSRHLRGNGSVGDSLHACLSECISELSRPIDAIKHQAKTITVGISRIEALPAEGVIWSVLDELGLAREQVLESHRIFLSALEPLVAAVEGVTLYRVSGLDALGRPADATRIGVERKLGITERIDSRCDRERPLSGNKWAVVKHDEVYLGYGQSDGRKILILPVASDAPSDCRVLLFHLQLESSSDRAARLKALRARGKFFDRLRAAVTERNLEWDESLIDALDNDTLLLNPPERVAEELAQTKV